MSTDFFEKITEIPYQIGLFPPCPSGRKKLSQYVGAAVSSRPHIYSICIFHSPIAYSSTTEALTETSPLMMEVPLARSSALASYTLLMP